MRGGRRHGARVDDDRGAGRVHRAAAKEIQKGCDSKNASDGQGEVLLKDAGGAPATT